MAPVENKVVGIDDDQRMALMKFRRSVQDITKPEHDDYFLLRWLRARQWDAEAAEKMLRDSVAWREKWQVDSVLSWQGPEVLEKHFPSGLAGFDKEGAPFVLVPFAGLDIWGLLHSVSKSDIVKMVVKHAEMHLATARKQAEIHGPKALKITVLFDLDEFNIRQYAWRPAAELVVTLLKVYEANYPEILKICYLVNAPKLFSLGFAVVKKFMHEYTLSKIKILGTDSKKWLAEVLNMVDKDQLPAYYGGTKVDEKGDPKCGMLINYGGKIPKSSYTKKAVSTEVQKVYEKVTIKTGDKHTVDLISLEPDSILSWEFGVDSHDIKFQIASRDEEGKETVIHGPRKVHEGAVDKGTLNVTGPATYTITFDNSSAFLRTRKVFYEVSVTNKALNLEDDDAPSKSLTHLCLTDE